MPGLDGRQDFDGDEQDQAETFDEDNFDASDPGFDTAEMRTFEEIPDVLDVTSRAGDDDDDEALIGEELDDDDIIEIELDSDATDIEDDDLRGRNPERYKAENGGLDDIEEAWAEEEGEVDLIDGGDLENVGARALKESRSLESSRLDDDDIEDLGYGPRDGDGRS